MQYSDTLSTIAEVSIALAGFTGVVAVLGRRSSGGWSSEELLQLRALVETSLAALFVSFVPGMVSSAVGSETAVWRWSNGFIAGAHLAILLAFFVRARNAAPTVGQKILGSVGAGFVLLHLGAAVGIVAWAAPLFVLGLLGLLFVAAHNFVLLLFSVRRAV